MSERTNLNALLAISLVVMGMSCAISTAATIYVDVDATGSNNGSSWTDAFNRIQDAVDVAVDGDTVLVADGIYTGNGNRNIDFKGKAITVKSQNGPQNCIINCEGSEGQFRHGFKFLVGETLVPHFINNTTM